MTKDANYVLKQMQKEFSLRRKNQLSKREAKCFDSSETIQKTLFPDWCFDDLEETLRELDQNGFLHNIYADGKIYYCELSDYAIENMENRTKQTVLNSLDFISKFIP